MEQSTAPSPIVSDKIIQGFWGDNFLQDTPEPEPIPNPDFQCGPNEPLECPNAAFPGRVPTDIVFIALLILLITANISVVFKCKVYTNFNSMCIMVFLTVLQFLRLITYFRRVIVNEYSLDMWVWYRATTDLCNYLLSVVALVLLVQWH